MPARRGHRRPGGPLRGSNRGPGFSDAGHGPARRLPAGDAPSRVLIDGRNVQHAIARAAGAANVPTAALVARLRAAFSPPIEVELILDGHAAGSPFGKVAPSFSVVFTRGNTADAVIGDRVTEALRTTGAVGAWSVLVVTDDREVRDHARRSGVRVEGTAWLVGRLPGGAGIGRLGTGGAGAGNAAPRGSKG